jgi:PrtD family type I secretion system ABC transporter
VVNDLRSRNPLNLANAASQNAYRHASANVRNAEVIEGMGMSKAAMKHWRQQNAMALEFQNLAIDRSGTISAASKTLRMILQILIFAVGAFLVIEQKASPGVMIAAVILMGRALSPVDAAIRTWKNLLGARAAYRRLELLLKRVPLPRSSMTLPAPTGRLAAEQLVYIPPGSDKPILRAVSFALEPGESLGVVGPSAAGKSSLAKLIVGVWDPTRGHVRLDGADVATWDPNDLGQYVGYLPQEVELFGGTIRENIARMSDAPSEDIVAAARLAGVHEMILDLPEGYETQIGEGGSILSGGQRQRIALARALFGRPRLLVLDEPNANIDQESGQDPGVAKRPGRDVRTARRGHRQDPARRGSPTHRGVRCLADVMAVFEPTVIRVTGRVT